MNAAEAHAVCIHALYSQFRPLFPAEILSSLYLDSAVSPSGSQCNDLSLLGRTGESLHIFHCGLKTHLIKRDVMSPTQLPFCRIFLLNLHLYWGEKSLLSFLFLNLAWLSTQLLSHTLLGTEGCVTLMLTRFTLPQPLVCLFFDCLCFLKYWSSRNWGVFSNGTLQHSLKCYDSHSHTSYCHSVHDRIHYHICAQLSSLGQAFECWLIYRLDDLFQQS